MANGSQLEEHFKEGEMGKLGKQKKESAETKIYRALMPSALSESLLGQNSQQNVNQMGFSQSSAPSLLLPNPASLPDNLPLSSAIPSVNNGETVKLPPGAVIFMGNLPWATLPLPMVMESSTVDSLPIITTTSLNTNTISPSGLSSNSLNATNSNLPNTLMSGISSTPTILSFLPSVSQPNLTTLNQNTMTINSTNLNSTNLSNSNTNETYAILEQWTNLLLNYIDKKIDQLNRSEDVATSRSTVSLEFFKSSTDLPLPVDAITGTNSIPSTEITIPPQTMEYFLGIPTVSNSSFTSTTNPLTGLEPRDLTQALLDAIQILSNAVNTFVSTVQNRSSTQALSVSTTAKSLTTTSPTATNTVDQKRSAADQQSPTAPAATLSNSIQTTSSTAQPVGLSLSLPGMGSLQVGPGVFNLGLDFVGGFLKGLFGRRRAQFRRNATAVNRRKNHFNFFNRHGVEGNKSSTELFDNKINAGDAFLMNTNVWNIAKKNNQRDFLGNQYEEDSKHWTKSEIKELKQTLKKRRKEVEDLRKALDTARNEMKPKTNLKKKRKLPLYTLDDHPWRLDLFEMLNSNGVNTTVKPFHKEYQNRSWINFQKMHYQQRHQNGKKTATDRYQKVHGYDYYVNRLKGNGYHHRRVHGKINDRNTHHIEYHHHQHYHHLHHHHQKYQHHKYRFNTPKGHLKYQH